MSEKIVQLNEEIIKGQIKELVRGSVEETLNELLEKEAESLTQAARYERSEARRRRQMHGDAGGRRRGVSGRQIPALHGAFLPQ
jgi:transposase-like protein